MALGKILCDVMGPLIVGAAIQPLELTGFIPYSFTVRHIFLVAILCEIVLMAMALADRVLAIKERKPLSRNSYSTNTTSKSGHAQTSLYGSETKIVNLYYKDRAIHRITNILN